MVFTTLKFIVFMTVVFFLYYTVPKRLQWVLLLVASYVFYAAASPLYLIFLLVTTGITYYGSLVMSKNFAEQDTYLIKMGKELTKEDKKQYKKEMDKKRRRVLFLVLFLLLLMLVMFKYATFLIGNMAWFIGIFGVNIDDITLNIIMPLGLSFYIFQSLGYCIDVYRETAEAQHNFFKYMLYVSFFPQLLQGPIGDYNRLAPQLYAGHEFSYDSAVKGVQRVAWGFFKKLVVANQLSQAIDGVWGQAYTGVLIWGFFLILYAFQLYADFSGYMDIANGCAQMLGITLDENFTEPYLSKSISEFWRKWHITLGAWFKNYVFYPVLRSRWCTGIRKKYKKSNAYVSNTLPNVIALSIVWLLIGLWHGADWCYVVYGLFHGSFIIMNTVLAPVYIGFHKKFPKLQGSKWFSLFQIVRTFLIVSFGYVIFRPANLTLTATILKHMFSGLGTSYLLGFGNKRFLIAAFIGIFVVFLVDLYHYKNKKSVRMRIQELPSWKKWMVYTVFLLMIIFLGAYGMPTLNQFAYFRF